MTLQNKSKLRALCGASTIRYLIRSVSPAELLATRHRRISLGLY